MVIKVNEANTSKLCSRCGSQGLRHNGKFVCPKCKVELNADRNGALNILKRARGYISRVGDALTQPKGDRMSFKKRRILNFHGRISRIYPWRVSIGMDEVHSWRDTGGLSNPRWTYICHDLRGG